MKTISLRVSSLGMLATLVRVVFVSMLGACSLFAQSASLASYQPAFTPAKATYGKAIAGLQVGAGPVENSAKVLVSFDNATGRKLLLKIENQRGETLYSKLYPDGTAFHGTFNLSLLGDGAYTLQISTLTKAGFVKQAYRQTFQVRSATQRSITPAEQGPQREPIPPYQVRR
jgi:hypothetical protein